MSQLKQLWAMTRLNIRLQLTDPAPTLILTVIPLVLIPFMMPAFKSMLLADGYTGATGAEQAVPSMAILFSFLAVQNIIGSFFNEHSWGTWERLEASPTSRASILTGKALVAYIMQTVQITVVLVLGAAIFGYHPKGSLVALMAVLLRSYRPWVLQSPYGHTVAMPLCPCRTSWACSPQESAEHSAQFHLSPTGLNTLHASPPPTGPTPQSTR